MKEQEFLWYFIKVALPTMAIITPILKLNTSIVKLNEKISVIIEQNNIQDARLNKHGEKIDEIDCSIAKHEVRLSNLEKKH